MPPQNTLSVTWEEIGLLDISNLMRLVVNLKVFFLEFIIGLA